MCRCRFVSIFLAFLIVYIIFSGKALATSGQRYPSGAEDFLCGVAPGPGLYLVNYSYWYSSSSLRDNDGHDVKVLKFNANIWVDAPRFLYFFPKKIFGAIYGVYVTAPIYYADIETKSHGMKIVGDHTSGIGDIVFSPLILGWHFGKRLHFIFSFDINAPTGHYDGKNLATTIISKNYWTFQPNISFSWIIGPGIDVSGKFIYEFHTDNDEYLIPPFFYKTTYSPGSGINLDFAFGVPINPNLRIGLNGFFYEQLKDDKIKGVAIKDKKVRNFALGPAIKYSGENWAVIFKEQFEIFAKNRPKGNVTWFKIQYQF